MIQVQRTATAHHGLLLEKDFRSERRQFKVVNGGKENLGERRTHRYQTCYFT